jgi:hypothetical protein
MKLVLAEIFDIFNFFKYWFFLKCCFAYYKIWYKLLLEESCFAHQFRFFVLSFAFPGATGLFQYPICESIKVNFFH